MEEYFLYLIENFSLEIFLMSLTIFGATMLLKIPIKRATAKLDEAKRQGINSLIILIPLVLSFVVASVYYAITHRQVLSLDYVSCSLSVCIMSISIYLIYSRLAIILKGIMTGKTKITDENVKEQVQEIVADASTAIEMSNQQKPATISSTQDKLDTLADKMTALKALNAQMHANATPNETQKIATQNTSEEQAK